jgi:hypothetical protein
MHEFAKNLSFGGNQFQGIHMLIRAMVKAGAWLRASSDGTTKVVNDDVTAHTAFPLTNTANSGGAASVTAIEDHPYGKLVTYSGLTGLVAPTVLGGNSEGNFLTFSGAANGSHNGTFQIYERVSPTSAKVLIRGGSPAGTDANNGSIAWQEKDILANATYGLGAAQWWALLETFRNVQLTGTVQPTGEFIAGETVTQAGTGATGQVIAPAAWASDVSKSSITLMPMSGQFNGTGVLTGATSGATLNPTTLYTYARNLVFSKGSTVDDHTGSGWYEVYKLGGAEETASYLTKASDPACDATVAPGGSTSAGNVGNLGTGYSLILRGENPTHLASPVVHATGIVGQYEPYPPFIHPNGRHQCVAANMIPRAGQAVDGTWRIVVGNTNTGGVNMLSCERLDGCPPNDVEPFVFHAQAASTSTTYRRLSYNELNRVGSWQVFGDGTRPGQYGYVHWFKVNGRSSERYGGAAPAVLGTYCGTTGSFYARQYNAPAYGYNRGYTARVYDWPGALAPGFTEPVGFNEGFGGRMRHLHAIQQGGLEDTVRNKKFFQIVAYDGITSSLGLVVGPWDETTDPAFAL